MKEKYTSPSFPWYPERFISSGAVQEMSHEEEWAYRRLIDHQWCRGYVPSDPDKVVRILSKVPPAKARKLWLAVQECFVEESPGRLVSPFLEEVREYCAGKSAAGTASAEARRRKARTTPGTKREQTAEQRRNKVGTEGGTKRQPPSSVVPSSVSPTESPSGDSSGGEIALGEFRRCRLTRDQESKLRERLGGNFDDYVAQFDRWVNEAPEAKAAGVKRKNRHAYESILSWFDRDRKEGKLERNGNSSRTERNAAALGIDPPVSAGSG